MPTKTTWIATQIRESVIALSLIIFIVNSAGCTSATPEFPPTSTGTAVLLTENPTTSPTPVKTPFPTPTETPFIPKATIKIVAHVPLSGNQADYGLNMMHAAKLAVAQLAGPLTELGYKIELVTYDDESSIAVAEANAMKIAADREILCGLGHYDTKVAIKASEIYHRRRLAFISLSDATTTVTDRGYLELNRVVGRDDSQGIAGAQFAQAQGYKGVYALGGTNQSSRKIMDYFKREADRIGLRIVGMFTTPVTDSEGAIRRVLAANPDLVYFAGKASPANRFLRKARAAGYMGAFLGTDGANSPTLIKGDDLSLIAGGGLYFTSIVAPAAYYPAAAQFVQDFHNVYSSFPELYAAQAYDAVGICMKAIEEASKTKGGEIPTRAEVATAMRTLKDFMGITGTFNFDKRGDPTPANYFVYKVGSINPDEWDMNTIIATLAVEPPN